MVPSSETTKDITGWIPVANATVTLTDSEGITHTVTTDEDGYYAFTDITVNANTIITATATIDGNTVIIKDVIPQAVAADEDYDAGTADAESTALALIVEELLEQGIDPEYINLEEIQDSDNFTEVVEQVSSILEENGNVTTDHSLTYTVGNVAEDIISPPAYTPAYTPPETPEPAYTPPPVTPKKLTGIEVSPDAMTLEKGDSQPLIVKAYYNDGSTSDITPECIYDSSAPGIAKVDATGLVTSVCLGTANINIVYTFADIMSVTVIEKIYGNVELRDWDNGNFPEVFDLTQCDLTLSYTIDMNNITNAGWAVTEVGLREVGYSNIDPDLKGGWMQSNYIYGTSNPDSLNDNDMHLLSKHGWLYQTYDAEDSDTLREPYWSGANYGFWFDRDGVDQWQAEMWGMVNGGTYNTNGIYEIVITYHSIDANTGTMFATINGVQQGLYTSGFKDAQPEFYPAGRSFEGDMTQMKVFYGRGGGGGTVTISDITIE